MDFKREIDPPYDLWPGIRERIRTRRRWRIVGPVFGIAAAATIAFVILRQKTPSPRITQVAPPAVVMAVDSDDAAIDARVERELLDELELRRGDLRPETEALVRASLQTIDSAITDLRAEMARRPFDPALAQLLAEAYSHKVDLMKLLANAS